MPFAHPQRGAAAVEFAIAAVPLLFAGLGAIEVARWLLVRQVLDLALLEAARAGSVQHARPQAIAQAFERALLPLFVPAGSYPSAQARMQAWADRLRRRTGLQPWIMEMLAPSADSFADFGARRGTAFAIANDSLAERHADALAHGRPGGRGPRSGQTVFQANVLHLRLTYLHAPLAPGMRGLLELLAGSGPGYADQARRRAGLLPIVRDIRVLMQSDAEQGADAAGTSQVFRGRAPPPAPCPGPDCGLAVPPLAGPPDPPASNGPGGSGPSDISGFPDNMPGPPNAGASGPAQADGDLCGTVLCCTG